MMSHVNLKGKFINGKKNLKRNWRAFVRIAILLLLLVVSITTIVVSIQLVFDTASIREAQEIRSNSRSGYSELADKMELAANENRMEIYESTNPIVAFIGNLPDFWQIFWAATFITAPFLYLYFLCNYRIVKK